MTVGICSIGTAIPQYRRSQMETVELVSAGLHLSPVQKRLLKALYKASGIDFRHSVLSDYHRNPGEFEIFPNNADSDFPSTAKRMQIYKDNALDLALAAIADCINRLPNGDLQALTHLITVSCTGMYAPGLDIELAQQLGLKSSIKRTCINFMGCYGAFNALKVAEAICRADANAKVLIVSVELCTLHFQKNTNTDNMISNALFADGAAAAIVEANSNSTHLQFEQFYCDILPQTKQEMAWHIADHGFDIVLSSYVPDAIERGICQFVDRLKQNADLEKVDYFAIHPGGLKILQACETALNLTKEDNRYSYEVLRNYGNMSSATILFVLKTLWNDLKAADNSKSILGCAFGPGLTLESMLLKVAHV